MISSEIAEFRVTVDNGKIEVSPKSPSATSFIYGTLTAI